MSLVTALRNSTRRPLVQSILVVSFACLLGYLFSADPPKQQQARKMHIESIPMCKTSMRHQGGVSGYWDWTCRGGYWQQLCLSYVVPLLNPRWTKWDEQNADQSQSWQTTRRRKLLLLIRQIHQSMGFSLSLCWVVEWADKKHRVLPSLKKATDSGIKLTNIINTHQ